VTLDVAEITGLGLLAALCVGLLRTNASLTRRVDALEIAAERARRRQAANALRTEASQEATMGSSPSGSSDAEPEDDPAPQDSADDGLVSLDGTTPDGSPLSVDLHSSDPQLVAFLSTSCAICTSLWEGLRSGALAEQSPTLRSIVVTKSAPVEDADRVRELSGAGDIVTVMSTQAWEDYEIPGSPYFLLVGGEPRDVIGEGPASGWADVSAIVGRLARAT
jgi:hypothetical protein